MIIVKVFINKIYKTVYRTITYLLEDMIKKQR